MIDFQRTLSFVAAAPVLLLAIAHAPVSFADEDRRDGGLWRRPERDGVNCLYLQLRLLGFTGRYKDLLAAAETEAEQASMRGLAQTANHLGFDLVPTKLTMTELARAPVAVVLFEEGGTGSGRFHLLLGMSSSNVLTINGEFVSRYEMSVDRFRRGWTGLALVPPGRSRWRDRWLGVGAGAGVAAVALVLARFVLCGRNSRGRESSEVRI